MIDWHRLFGIALTLHFADYPLTIELEKELAIKRQLLDILILKKGDQPILGPLPDGLEDLAQHNLLTYKSLQEPLDDWTLKELTGHYVNYRKLVSPSLDNLLPEENFSLLAVATRYPQKLIRQSGSNWQRLKEGVYQVKRGSDIIRVIVLKKIPNAERNLVWQLFSAQQEKVQEAARSYLQSDSEINTIMNELLKKYQAEGIHMPYTLDDYRKEYVRGGLHLLTPEEVLTRYEPQQRLAGLALEERLAGLDAKDILAGLSAKDREWFAKALLSEQRRGSQARDES